MKLIVGNKNYSTWSLRAWLYLAYHDIAFEEERIPLYQPESTARITAYSPGGKVPVLVDGTLRVWESLAILEYLAEKFPATTGWPADPIARAHARALSSEMHAGFTPLRTHCGMSIKRHFPPRDAATPWPAEVLHDIARIDSMWNDARTRFGVPSGRGSSAGGPFLFGAFGIADCMFAPVCWRAHIYSLPLSGAARDYAQMMIALPAMQRWRDAALAETEFLARFEPAPFNSVTATQ